MFDFLHRSVDGTWYALFSYKGFEIERRVKAELFGDPVYEYRLSRFFEGKKTATVTDLHTLAEIYAVIEMTLWEEQHPVVHTEKLNG